MAQSATALSAAEQLLQSLPNPSRIKEIHLDIVWRTTGRGGPTAAIIVGLLVLAIIATAICVTVYNIRS